MRVCGIICEYNPFHNGHAHQLACARRLAQADYLICVMSGPFVQRGDAAVLDKWTRAQMALEGGADLVIELPALFAVRAAADFARGGVALLDRLRVVTHLSFGSEEDDLAALYALAAPESQEQSQKIRAYLRQGLSHPAARAKALGADMPPNVTLAVEYLRALAELDRAISPVPVLRRFSHHDVQAHAMASATALRLQLAKGNFDLEHAMPPQALALLRSALPQPMPSLPRCSDMLLYLLRTTAPEQLRDRYAIPEGLENRLCREAFEAIHVDELLCRVKCKRYPLARLRRLLVQILLGLDAQAIKEHPAPEYARVLGFKKTAAPLMRAIEERGDIPLIVKAADAPKTALMRLDFQAQDIWDLLAGHAGHRDLTERLRILEG